MFQIILSTMFQHFKHLAQLQLNETSQGEVMCSDVGSISENFLQNQQTESTYWIYKMDLKSTKIESGMHKLLEPHTPQNLLDTTVPHFLANWKKSTRVMCIWDIVGGATHHCHLFQPIEFRIWLQSLHFYYLFTWTLCRITVDLLKVSSSSWFFPPNHSFLC